MAELSVMIPARNEGWLARTIQDILAHREADTEVIAVCDGSWPDPPLQDHPKLTVIHFTKPVGQRYAVNQGVRISRAKYVMKLDAHCALDQSFDRKCVEALSGHPDWTLVPVQRNLHRDGILAVTEVYEGNLPAAQVEQAVAAAKSVAIGLNYVGVLCVEFFVLDNGQLVVNEIAPRPHNSGHYSQNALDVSQFELQVRCMTNLPLVQPRQHSATVMLNLLGDLWFKHGDTAQTPAWEQILALPGAHLHLYGKVDAKRARKMGHLNITAATPEQARATALKAADILGIPAF